MSAAAKACRSAALSLMMAGLGWCGAAHAQSSASPYTYGTRYDAMGRVTGTITPDPDGGGPLPFIAVRNIYDQAGRLIETDEGTLGSWQAETVSPTQWSGFSLTKTTTFTYDQLDRKLTEKVQGSDGTAVSLTQYSYDLYNRLQCTAVRMNPAAYGSLPSDACTLGTQGTSGPDRITKAVYDAAGQLVQQRKAVGTSLEQAYATYSFTQDGKQADVVDANGNHAMFAYDGFDRVASWSFPSPTPASSFNGATPASALSSANAVNANDYEAYGYDANGNRTSFRKRDGTTLSYGYDALNRMTTKTVPGSASGAAGYTVGYGYDLRNLQLSAVFANGQGITNTYDGFGELASTTSTMGGTSRTLGYQYDADGNRLRVTHPDGVYFASAYDGLDRASGAQWWTAGSGTTSFLGIGYAPQGWRTSMTRGSSGTSYGYDTAGRLTAQGQQFAGGTGNVNVTLGYNAASQIVTQTRDTDAYAWTGAVNVSRSYGVNGLNQYTAAGPATFSYDANANLTSDGTNAYVYDAENRLVHASNGTMLAYDPDGRLRQVTSGSGTRQLLYDGDELAAEYDGSGNLLRRYMFEGEDAPILEDAGGALNCSGTRFLSVDHQGSVIAQADCSGNRQAVDAYDEYGIPGAGNTGRFGYTGQAWIPELGMWYYKARIYSPTLGRFLQTDPIGYKDQIDLYAYVGHCQTNVAGGAGG